MVGILLIIGKIVLVLLAAVAALLCCVLFWPVRYRFRVQAEGKNVRAGGTVWWLLHALHVRIIYNTEDRLRVSVFLFGFRVWGTEVEKSGKRKPVSVHQKEYTEDRPASNLSESAGMAKKRPTIQPGERKEQRKINIEIVPAKRPGLFRRFLAKIRAFFLRIRNSAETIRALCGKLKLWIRYLQSASFRRLYLTVKKHGILILRHILPRKIKGNVHFGFTDPATTGEVLAVLALGYPLIPPRLQIRPDFEKACMDADVILAGHIEVVYLLIHALCIVLNRDFRKFRNFIRKMKKKTPDHPVSSGAQQAAPTGVQA